MVRSGAAGSVPVNAAYEALRGGILLFIGLARVISLVRLGGGVLLLKLIS